MQGQALVQLTLVGLQFNELFSSNPFSYYTSTINHSFTVVFNEEKTMQKIRDDLLLENDQSPSWTKQLETDMARTKHWDDALGNNNLDGGEVVEYDESSEKVSKSNHYLSYSDDDEDSDQEHDKENEVDYDIDREYEMKEVDD